MTNLAMEKLSPRYAECQNIKLRNAHCRQVQSFIRGYATYPHVSATCVLYTTLRCLIPPSPLEIWIPKFQLKQCKNDSCL